MRELITAATGVTLLLAATLASAQETSADEPFFGARAEEGLEQDAASSAKEEPDYLGQLTLGLRTGYTIPMGKVTRDGGGVELKEIYSTYVPLMVDIGYEPIPNLMLGVFGLWGPAFVADAAAAGEPGCAPEADCFGHVFRGGAQAHLLLLPRAKLNPWVGLGAGYEFAFTNVSAAGTKTRILYRGPEIINAQLGLDIKPKPRFGFGPFASFAVARYTNCKTRVNDSPGPRCDIDRRTQHEWVLVGARVYFSAIQVRKKGLGP